MPSTTGPIAYLTAGAGGMICGSCLHDNTLARAMLRRGVDVQLIPTYTPIRTDEEDVSSHQVFYGGVNVFLSQFVPAYRYLPSVVTKWLDHPRLIRWATKRASATSAKSLGGLTVSMLQGVHGNQRRETEELCSWLGDELQPRMVVLSNALIAGCVPRLKERCSVPVLVTLQGDDIFLDSLPEPYREQSLQELRRLVQHIDGFLVNSRFYAQRMGEMLRIPPEKFCQVPLGVDLTGYPVPADRRAPRSTTGDPIPTIGYLARIAPEKGFHVLIDAFLELRRRGKVAGVQLRVAGWQGPQHARYYEEQLAKLHSAGCFSAFHYAGSVSREDKIRFLSELDVCSVPTTYADPKGLFVLEALAAGVPVVMPNHGAFPELLADTGGGQLVPPNDPTRLAEALEDLLVDHPRRHQLGLEGHATVHARFHSDAMAAAVWEVWQRFLP